MDAADIASIQAMSNGTATEAQQKRALKWIIEGAAGITRDAFDPVNSSVTNYMLGRQSVGRMILDVVNSRTVKTGGEDGA